MIAQCLAITEQDRLLFLSTCFVIAKYDHKMIAIAEQDRLL